MVLAVLDTQAGKIMVRIRETNRQKSRQQPPKLGRETKTCCCNQWKSSSQSTKERPCQVCVQLGGHGGCCMYSNSPEMVGAGGTSELKSRQQPPQTRPIIKSCGRN
jgi:hypothetical protein